MSRAKLQRTQQLSQLKPMNPHRQTKKPAPPPSGNPLLDLLQKHALLLFVALWAGLLGVGVSAGKVLIYSDVDVESASTAAKSQNEAVSIQNSGKLPVLLFGAIALTCVAGSWMILQQLHDPKPRRPVRRPRPRPRPISPQMSSTDQQRQPPGLPRRDIPAWGTQQRVMPRRPSPIQPLVPDEPDEKKW